jgi:putative RecB family exonuclease
LTRYSHSRIGAFENCPYQYKLRYIDRIKADVEGIEAFMGSRVHEVFEKLYDDKKRCKENTLEELLAYYDEVWDKNWHEGIEIVRAGYTPQNYRDMGAKAIREYYASHQPFDEGKVLGIEKQVTVPLGTDTEDTFIGYIDRLMLMPEGRYEIHDYKASGSLPAQEKVDTDRQLALYQLAIENDYPDAKDNVGLVWHYVLFDKDIRSTRTRKQLDVLIRDIRSKIDEINAATEFVPKESSLCSWCGYRALCPSFKHEAKMEEKAPNEFLQDDGVQLVNKYVAVDLKLKELELEKDQLKDAIIQYAAKEEVKVIVGSGHKLKISSSETVGFPSKSTDLEKYRELVSILKGAGVWEEISSLDRNALKEKLESSGWSAILREAVEVYAERGVQTRITKSKVKGEE